MSQSALLICNGEPPSARLARKLASSVDVVIAADGGANAARQLGIRPDVIIGDLDSMTASTKRSFTPHMEGKGLKPLQVGDGIGTLYPRPLDFASLRRSRKGRGYTQIIQVKRQDNTDLQKALDYLRMQHIKNPPGRARTPRPNAATGVPWELKTVTNP